MSPDAAGPTGRSSSAVRVWAVSWLWSPMFSGAAVQGQRLYGALAGEEFEITVLTARHGQAASRPREEMVDGARVRRLAVLPAWASGWPRLGAVWSTARQACFSLSCALRILAARRSVDVLHIHAAFLPPLVLLARLLRIPVIVKQTIAGLPGRGLGGRMQRMALSRADRLITMSHSMRRGLAELDQQRIDVIAQGVDTTLFQPVPAERKLDLRRALGLEPGMIWIAFVGAIQPRKGVDILVRAFVEAVQKVPSLGLLLIGQYEFGGHPAQHMAASLRRYRESLQETLERHGVSARVRWVGKLAPPEVANHLQAADLFCLPSRLEGTPSAPLEAMACGLPVVVSALDGTSAELLSDGREGFIVCSEEPRRYAACFEILASDLDAASRMGDLGRRKVVDCFSFAQAISRYRELFRSLTGRGENRDRRGPAGAH